MPEFPKGFPHFDTEEELHSLIQEALNDPRPPIRMDEKEWERLYNEMVPSRASEKLPS